MNRQMWKTGLLATLLVYGTLLVVPYASASCHEAVPNVIPNPISFCTFETLVTRIAEEITRFAAIVAGIAIVIVGFKLITASVSGNPGEIQAAKKMFVHVVIGSAIVVGAAALAAAVVNTIKGL